MQLVGAYPALGQHIKGGSEVGCGHEADGHRLIHKAITFAKQAIATPKPNPEPKISHGCVQLQKSIIASQDVPNLSGCKDYLSHPWLAL